MCSSSFIFKHFVKTPKTLAAVVTMANSTAINCIQHIETYIDSSSSRSPAQQEASLDAIAKLLVNDVITLNSL
ncbi:hypothetical protein Tco_0083235, partial [Tanacetum coccineum]